MAKIFLSQTYASPKEILITRLWCILIIKSSWWPFSRTYISNIFSDTPWFKTWFFNVRKHYQKPCLILNEKLKSYILIINFENGQFYIVYCLRVKTLSSFMTKLYRISKTIEKRFLWLSILKIFEPIWTFLVIYIRKQFFVWKLERNLTKLLPGKNVHYWKI